MDLNNPLLLGAGLCLLCVVGGALVFGAQIIASILEVFGTAVGVVGGFISGGPGLWCGCVFVLVLVGIGAVVAGLIVSTLQACGTPAATNFCSLFGR